MPESYIESSVKEIKEILAKLKIDDRVEKFYTKQAFCILKDHKVDFGSKLEYRVLNHSKQIWES